MGQCQTRVLICTILVVVPYTMTHTKFQGHWSIGSGEEVFLKFLPYMGMVPHVGYIFQLICINFHSHSPLSFHMSFGSKSLNCFCEKQVLTLKSECSFTKVKECLTFDTHSTSLTHLVECFKQL